MMMSWLCTLPLLFVVPVAVSQSEDRRVAACRSQSDLGRLQSAVEGSVLPFRVAKLQRSSRTLSRVGELRGITLNEHSGVVAAQT